MSTQLRRALGFRDLVLFYLVTTFSLRWIATAAVAGPSAIVLWILGGAGLFVPLVFAVVDLSSRYPDEGGLYVWSKRAFGPFAGFITGWSYWATNLPYLPSLLYFIAANALYMGGTDAQRLSTNSAYFIAVSIVGLSVSVWLNVIGLDVSKWLSNAGAIAGWLAIGLLIPFGVYSWIRFGSATAFTWRAFIPGASLKDLIFLSTIAFAYSGIENASTMGDEIVDARRTVPRAVVVSAIAITALYIVGTTSVLVALPPTQVSGLQGLVQAMQAIGVRAGVPWLAPVVAGLVVLNVLGAVTGWFAATARLPFVAGLDSYLPEAFGRLHPKWNTPHVALLVQALFAAFFVVLGQAGTTVRGAYEALVGLAIIAQFIPYLFMFAAAAKLTGRKALAVLGFIVSVATIVLACVPSADDPNKTLAVIKIVGGSAAVMGAGALVYFLGKRRS